VFYLFIPIQFILVHIITFCLLLDNYKNLYITFTSHMLFHSPTFSVALDVSWEPFCLAFQLFELVSARYQMYLARWSDS